MAEISKLTGFVENWNRNDITAPNPEWAMKVSEPHAKKVDDKFVTDGRTFWTVKAMYGVSIDFTQFRAGDRVELSGRSKTVEREHEGKKYYDLVLLAETVKHILPQVVALNPRIGTVDAQVAPTHPSLSAVAPVSNVTELFPNDADAPF